jgi:hypothetical protein
MNKSFKHHVQGQYKKLLAVLGYIAVLLVKKQQALLLMEEQT